MSPPRHQDRKKQRKKQPFPSGYKRGPAGRRLQASLDEKFRRHWLAGKPVGGREEQP